MKCEIIRDLLPLYADGIASAETSKAVEEHIAVCEECGKIYEKMTEASEEIADPKIKREIKRDVDYMKKIKNRGKKIAAAIVGGVLSAAAIVLLFLKLFYWGFAVTAEDIDITCNISERSNRAGNYVDVNFDITLKNGLALRHDDSRYLNYGDDGTEYRYNYVTPRAVVKNPLDMPENASSMTFGYGIINNGGEIGSPGKYELHIILKDTSYSYDINKIVEEYLEKSSE